MPGTPRIEPGKMTAWAAFLHANAHVLRRLSAELEAADQVPMTTYDILVQLSEAGGSLRLRDLLDRLVVVSQPGLSRRVERLAAAGLVERRPDPEDGRGVIVRLSRAGRATLRSAAAVHMTGIAREFADRVSDEEAAVFARVCARLSVPPGQEAAPPAV
ncbi:MarR family winged helix-turn-helix transcriptional regulator [Nakamurella alba]|nr:MarR family transcriptional regulator [Nakamurella alba]